MDIEKIKDLINEMGEYQKIILDRKLAIKRSTEGLKEMIKEYTKLHEKYEKLK